MSGLNKSAAMTCAIAVVSCVGFIAYLNRDMQLDDALIYLRYFRNLQNGLGLVYNPGERFNGLTSPLFTYVMAALSCLGVDLLTQSVAISALFLSVASIFAGFIVSANPVEPLVTCLGVAAFSYFYSTFGLETCLLLALFGLCLHLYKINSPWLWIALSLLAITRSEGVLVGIVIAVEWVAARRPMPRLRLLVLPACIYLAPLLFNTVYYGAPIPATLTAKIGQGRSGLWGEGWIFLDWTIVVDFVFQSHRRSLLILMAFAGAGAIDALRMSVGRVAILGSCLILAFYAMLNVPPYHWYFAPAVYVFIICAVHGIFVAAKHVDVVVQRSPPSRLVSSGILASFGAVALLAYIPVTSGYARGAAQDYVETGAWLEANTPPAADIGLVEIGTVGWYANRRIIDILGLVNTRNAELIGRRDFTGWLRYYQPEYLLRHEPAWDHEQSIAAVESDGLYQPVAGFNVKGLVLLQRAPDSKPEDIARWAENHRS